MKVSLSTRQVSKKTITLVKPEVKSLDFENAPDFDETLTNISVANSQGYIIDLSAVEYIDSTGLSVLFTFYKMLKEKNQIYFIINAQAAVKNALDLVRLSSTLGVLPNEKVALQRFADQP